MKRLKQGAAALTGVLLLLIFVTYIGIQVYQAMHGKNPEAAAADAEVTEVAAAEADTASNSAGRIFFYWSSVLLLSQSAQTC